MLPDFINMSYLLVLGLKTVVQYKILLNSDNALLLSGKVLLDFSIFFANFVQKSSCIFEFYRGEMQADF